MPRTVRTAPACLLAALAAAPIVGVKVSAGGFDWGAAGVGAAGTLGATGLTAGLLLALRHRPSDRLGRRRR